MSEQEIQDLLYKFGSILGTMADAGIGVGDIDAEDSNNICCLIMETLATQLLGRPPSDDELDVVLDHVQDELDKQRDPEQD